MAALWVDPSDLPEPPIPNRAARAARLDALPYQCRHTGCYETLQQAGQCALHQGCEFGAHRHPCPAAAEIGEAEYEAATDGPGPFDRAEVSA